ncbi:MAG TPA: GNAT family N-acetyltransferase [Gemmatales bacterium]|nr:GNAT family N-acetyltransferase [Gemmatales bacterium]
MPVHIQQVMPNTPAAVELINELEAHLESFGYPAQSRHGFSVEKLVAQQVDFFVMNAGDIPVGCGGIKLFSDYGEVKRMFVRPEHQGRGYGQAMLRHLGTFAQQHGIGILRLETGIHQHPAIKLYERFGFQRRDPFGEYRLDPNSIYYEMQLQ